MRASAARRLSTLFVLLAWVCGLAVFAAGQVRVTSIGIVGFADESGAGISDDVLRKTADGLQQELNSAYKDVLLARALRGVAGGTVEQLAALGRQNGVRFVVRGGVLSLGASTQLFADVIAVETGRVTTVRAEGEPQNAEAALSKAVRQLSAAIHQLVTSAAAAGVSPAPPADSPAASTSDPAIPDPAETEEELWQLMAEAELILGSPSAVSAETLNALRQSLESLRDALQAKAALVAEGKDASEVDRTIASRQQDLRSALASAVEQMNAAQDAPSHEPTSQTRSLLAALGEQLAEATNILQQLQELRAAWDAARDDEANETGASSGDQQPVEESFEEINGAVTEDGEPVEGVTVTEPESGETATTDANGSYVLRAVPGKLTYLVLTRGSARLSTGPVQVQRGRPSIADFELKTRVASPRNAAHVLPATTIIRSTAVRSGSTGRLTGIVRDARGRPVARALVTLRGVAAARTDSQGRYTFIRVPAGTYQLTVYRPGSSARSSDVRIMADRTIESATELASRDPGNAPQRRPSITSSGAGTLLRGAVTTNDRRPLAGAKVTLSSRLGAVSVLTSATGAYVLRDIGPGAYRAIVAKFGYATETRNVELRRGRTEEHSFTLARTAAPTLGPFTRPAPPGTRPTPSIEPGRSPAGTSARLAPMVPRPAAPGAIRGQVVDAKTGKPLAGAVVSIAGRREIPTDRNGAFSVIDIQAGRYQVLVRGNGYVDAKASVDVRAGQTATLSIRLTPRPAMRRR